MTRQTLRGAAAVVSGLVFGAGLVICDLTNPQRVIGALDLTAFDPTLPLCLVTAVAVYMAFGWLTRGREAPVADSRFDLPEQRTVTRSLVGGAAVFGFGWGLAGVCPAPAVAGLVSGEPSALLFAISLLGGIAVWDASASATAAAPRAAGDLRS